MELTATLSDALGDDGLAAELHARLGAVEFEVFALLAHQACRGIDYRKLGVSWDHPVARLDYRSATHSSFIESHDRQQESREALVALARRLANPASDGAEAESLIVSAFLCEIGVDSSDGASQGWSPALERGVLQAVREELTMPLRALNEAAKSSTYNGAPLPRQAIVEKIQELTQAVVEGRFSEWRYGNAVGQRQLAGLSDDQRRLWSSTSELCCRDDASSGVVVRVNEGLAAAGELDYFWATKVGGPSHGFDFETQCLMPLLCNARHKVILVHDAGWPHYAAGRVHFRLLWTHPGGLPRLWLEAVNIDFAAQELGGQSLHTELWMRAVFAHAMAKADAMNVTLSVDPRYAGLLQALASEGSTVVPCESERLVLRPSNGVVEASDYLTEKHDWLQVEEEITAPLMRALYTPALDSQEPVMAPCMEREPLFCGDVGCDPPAADEEGVKGHASPCAGGAPTNTGEALSGTAPHTSSGGVAEEISNYAWCDKKASVNIYVELAGVDGVPDGVISLESDAREVSMAIDAVGSPPRRCCFSLRGLHGEIAGAHLARRKGKDTVVLKLQKVKKVVWERLVGP